MKIQIVGTGQVGAAVANEILNIGVSDTLHLVDNCDDKAEGVQMDLERVAALKDLPVTITSSKYPMSRGFDVNILCLGSRCRYRSFSTPDAAINDLLEKNWPSVSIIATGIKEGRILVVTNPAKEIAKRLQRDFPSREIAFAGDLIDQIHDGRAIHEKVGHTCWGIAAEVGGML